MNRVREVLTAAVVRDLLTTWDDVPAAVGEWLDTWPDRTTAAAKLGECLAHDFHQVHADDSFVGECVRAALDLVDWPGVARQLLDRYYPPGRWTPRRCRRLHRQLGRRAARRGPGVN